jgi:hypothetical protein
MEYDHEAIAAKLESVETNVDWQSAIREIREAVIQVLQSLNELQTRVVELENDSTPESSPS